MFLRFELQTARFRQFWDEAAKSRHIVDAVPGISKISSIACFVSHPNSLIMYCMVLVSMLSSLELICFSQSSTVT